MQVGAARLEDRLAPDEPPYRSRGEAQVGRLLDRYGIPFFYEHPLVVHDRGRYRVWHPDFTLPEHGRLIVEYAGMPDVPDYAAGIRHKQQVYDANGIAAIFVYPDDLRGPDWPERLIDQIREKTSLARLTSTASTCVPPPTPRRTPFGPQARDP